MLWASHLPFMTTNNEAKYDHHHKAMKLLFSSGLNQFKFLFLILQRAPLNIQNHSQHIKEQFHIISLIVILLLLSVMRLSLSPSPSQEYFYHGGTTQ